MARLCQALVVVLTALLVVSTVSCTASGKVAAPAPAAQPAATATAGAPPPAAAFDPWQLPLPAADIPIPGFLPPQVEPLAEDAVGGLSARYDSDADRRQLGTTIVQLPDPAAATQAMRGAAASTKELRAGATVTPVQVGDTAVLVTGYQLDGVSSTLLLFSQGRASVAMEFRTPSSAPIPDDAVLTAGTRQADRIKATFG